jgi:ATP-dependent DNA helicase RecG
MLGSLGARLASSCMSGEQLTLRHLKGKPVSELQGVGPKLEERLAMVGITTVLDLLQHYPRRYVDRTHRADIAELTIGDEATVVGEVRRVSSRRTKQGRALVEITVSDGTSNLPITFFNQAWRERQLPVGTEAAFFGKLEVYQNKRKMTNPVVDVLGRAGEGDEKTGVIVPIYPQSGKADINTWELRKLVTQALRRCAPKGFSEPLPEDVLDARDLVDRNAAYRAVHQPASMGEAHAARHRLKFDEFLRLQTGLVARKRAMERTEEGIAHSVDGHLVTAFREHLPFPFTGDQQRAIAEIDADLARAAPMHRLLQGDVGSGKTVVALHALLVAVQGGYQGALMAPTEVLAEQHFLSAREFLAGLTVSGEDGASLFAERPLGVALLTNRTTAAERRELTRGLADGTIDIVVGTHALLYDTAEFRALGVAVIDEQHRFGVEQRSWLRERASQTRIPDVLVMTATPIPRTAAMLVYGDLDKSELREMPPGRTPIVTEVIGPEPLDRERAYARLRDEVAAGHQAFVVCPLVEGSDKVQAKAVTAELVRLSNEDLAGLRLGLLHGQLPSRDKEAVMAEFRSGGLDALVSTTVIEVGVDVPNATVMIVEDADRFGLSQLHQLRGRVGRAGDQSWCFLFADPGTDDGQERMDAMAASTDGFELAERDLEIRGAGEVFGERQSGLSDLKLGRIPRDADIVADARAVAVAILDADPALELHRDLADEVQDLLGDQVEMLFKS